MKLDKLGMILNIEDVGLDWAVTHAEAPFLDLTYDKSGESNLYFGTRNKNNKSQICRVRMKFKMLNKWELLYTYDEPMLRLGDLGYFDDSAVKTPWIVHIPGHRSFMYYTGWMEGKNVLYHPSIGLASYNPDIKAFVRSSLAPIIHRSSISPIGHHCPCVIYDGMFYRMFYSSLTAWENMDGEKRSYYCIGQSRSTDGRIWDMFQYSIIHGADNFARPCIIYEDGKYKMWYSYSKYDEHRYRIGYAESVDRGITWETQHDKIEFDVGPSGSFDSDMMAYPYIFNYQGIKYMLYNGNDFGKKGIGYGIIYD